MGAMLQTGTRQLASAGFQSHVPLSETVHVGLDIESQLNHRLFDQFLSSGLFETVETNLLGGNDSQDLDELMEMSDRIGAICGGRLSLFYPTTEMTVEKVGLLMAGVSLEEGATNVA